jgi:hypothetical protein
MMGTPAKSNVSISPVSVKSSDVARVRALYFFRSILPAIAVIAVICLSLSSKAHADQKTASISIPAFLDSTLDSKKRAAGDEVDAKAAAPLELSNGIVIPRGAKIVGHVIASKARSKGDSESSLNIVFEKVTLADGTVLNIKGYIQAVAPNPEIGESGGGVDYGNSLNRTLQHAGPGETSHNATPVLNPQSVGVEGIKDLALDGAGVLTSPGKTVKLEHGSQMVLRAEMAK